MDMGLTIKELFRKISLPKHYHGIDFALSQKFAEEAKRFMMLLESCDGSEFRDDVRPRVLDVLLKVRSVARQNIKSIQKIINSYDLADSIAAQKQFDKLMDRISNDAFISTIDDTVIISKWQTHFRANMCNQYYRLRAVDYPSTDISEDPDELFHIPWKKRSLVNNERFSVAGFPCLYLSTSLSLAWQECGYPAKYYYSEYMLEQSNHSSIDSSDKTRELKFLSFYLPSEINCWGTSVVYNEFDLWIEVVGRYLKVYPLVLACSFVNHGGKTPFKQEYIISQMLMQWVRRNFSRIQGISYFSCIDTSMWSYSFRGYNIAIPALEPYDNKGYSKDLRKAFCWTMPKFYTVPIADPAVYENYQKFLLEVVSDIDLTMRLPLPVTLQHMLTKLLDICSCLLSILDKKSTQNVEHTLHILDIVRENCFQLKRDSLTNSIESLSERDFDTDLIPEEVVVNSMEAVKKVLSKFINETNGETSVIQIVSDLRLQCWNFPTARSYVTIYYSDCRQLHAPFEWMNKNHIIHFSKELKADDESIQILKDIAHNEGQPIQIFWDDTFACNDEAWMKQNIHLIKGPILVEKHEVPRFYSGGCNKERLLQIGFNKALLRKKLKL